MSEQQKELCRLEENCYKIDKFFDTGEECLEFSRKQIISLEEEFANLEISSNRFSDIINGYNDYKECLKDYIINNYIDFFTFIVIECVIYFMSLSIILKTPEVLWRIVFLIAIVIVSLFNVGVCSNVVAIRKKIQQDIYSRYNIDLRSLTDEDVDNMSITLLQSKIREVKLDKEIEEYEYYICWKTRRLELERDGEEY